MTGNRGWLGAAGTPLRSLGEFGLIARLRDRIARRMMQAGLSDEGIAVGLGDDAAAIVPSSGHEILVTCDIQVAGRHFVPAWTPPGVVGARCATISMSDIGAMGGYPTAAVVSLGLGAELAVEDVEALYEGILDRMLPLRCHLIGGNVTSIERGIVVDITVLGEVEAGRSVRRDTGRAGDIVWVTGAPGSAAAGLALLQAGLQDDPTPEFDTLIRAYLEPRGRVGEGRELGRRGVATSMIDVSDGLIGDLRHMVEETDLGIVLLEEFIPIEDALRSAGARLGRPPDSFILGASDDYELLFTTTPADEGRTIAAVGEVSDVPLHRIGALVAGGRGEIVIEDRGGRRRPIAGVGWDHFPPDRAD